jgi:hypothetical protein
MTNVARVEEDSWGSRSVKTPDTVILCIAMSKLEKLTLHPFWNTGVFGANSKN